MVGGPSPDQSVADMLAVKADCVGLAIEGSRQGRGLLRGGLALLEAVCGALSSKGPQLSCPACQWVLRWPVVLGCGHAVCKPCLGSACPECGGPVSSDSEQSVLVRAAVEKWWPRQLEAERLRSEGIHCSRQGFLQQALTLFDAGLSICGENHLLLEARSDVLQKLNKLELSLEDAISVIKLRPFWSKGYYRKAVVLTSLGLYEDAFVAFALCAALEKNCNRVKHEFIKILQKLLTSTTKRVPLSPWKSSNYITPKEANAKLNSDDVFDGFNRTIRSSSPIFESRKLDLLLDRVFEEIEKTKKIEANGTQIIETIDGMEVEDFECVLCCRTLWRPVTTPCGHTYCAVCLDRSLDYSPNCPLCMTSLSQYVGSSERQVTVFLEVALAIGLPTEYWCRLSAHRAELAALSSAPEIPVFVCTTAYPTVSCPLYVFEPRYRLMIRRAVESGTRQFGMAAYTHQPSGVKRYAEYGTMLEIKDWVLMNDGCSILSCVGARRFRVISRSERDGYDTAQVHYLADDPITVNTLQEVTDLHDRVRKRGLRWFRKMSQDMQTKILRTFGEMPAVEENWSIIPNGPAWAWWLVAILPLGHHLQVSILKTTCFAKRLRAIEKTLKHFEESPENKELQNKNCLPLKQVVNSHSSQQT